MNHLRIDLRWIFLLLFGAIGLLGTAMESPADSGPGTATNPAEVEKYVKARIELGESMRDYFRRRGAPRFGDPEGGGPSMEELRKMEEEINAHVAAILAKHDLTIEEYQKRSPEVFADKEAVNRFLSEHPDFKQRYEALPPSPMRRGR
jgi:hypothetical protein